MFNSVYRYISVFPQNHDDISLSVSKNHVYNLFSGINLSKSHTLGNHNYRINLILNLLGEASIFLYGTVFVDSKSIFHISRQISL